jgi:hypothetical protein
LERDRRDSETAIGETQMGLRNSNWRDTEGTLKQQLERDRRDSERAIGETQKGI